MASVMDFGIVLELYKCKPGAVYWEDESKAFLNRIKMRWALSQPAG